MGKYHHVTQLPFSNLKYRTGVKFSMLQKFRVLDLTDEIGQIAGKILADMGADVIKLEEPGGCAARRIGPFQGDIPDPEKSLSWFAFNTGKKSITLDIETAAGRSMFDKLIPTADIIIESFIPGYLDKIRLGYQHCRQLNSGLVMVSISPYGQTGPYRDIFAYDLQDQAMSGTTNICGYPGEAPLSWGGQAYVQVGVQAALASLMALFRCETLGEGQHIDISIREAMTALTTIAGPVNDWIELKKMKKRHGGAEEIDHLVHRWFYPCKDGYIIWLIQLGVMGHATNTLMKWVVEEGKGKILETEVGDWTRFGLDDVTQSQLSQWESVFAEFFTTRTKRELLEEAVKRRVMLLPVSNMAELLANPQLAARDYWRAIPHPLLGRELVYPGAFYRSSEVNVGPWVRSPLIGEHNENIYLEELGFTREQLVSLRESNVI